MNITPQVPNLSIPTVLNPHTESLRRENNQREIITQPAPTNQSAAEKGVASERERSRTPAQNNANIDFASISEQAELANTSISEQNSEQNDPQNSTQEVEEQATSIDEEKTQAQALEQEQLISELKRRDQEVRSHEAAHSSVGGTVTGTPSFSYEKGPDGKRYATGGEVSVDLSSVKGDPKATIEKMQKVHAAALAPVHPSVQDTQVANTATQIMLQAQAELLTELGDDLSNNREKSATQASEGSYSIKNSEDEKQTSSSKAFDVLINKTLDNQEKIAPSQSEEVVQRALRIENYYSSITQADEASQSYQFELTA